MSPSPKRVAACGLLLAVAGCGGDGTGATTSAAGGWKATDACALIDKASVAAAIGGTVEKANLGAVQSEGGGFPLRSQCEFKMADGRMLVFSTVQSTLDGETLEHQVADLRRQTKLVDDKEPVAVPDIGKAALWSPDMRSLYGFYGDGRYAGALLMQTDFRKAQDPPETVKAQEIALLRKAGL